MRHDIYAGVLFYITKRIKPNYAELGRQYHCDPRTVKKYYEAGKENELEKIKVRKTRKRVSKLEPYKTLIEEKLELGCTATAIYKYISKKDYEGKYTILRKYCKDKKEKEIKKAPIRVETRPGIAAQVDWKEYMVMRDKIWQTLSIHYFYPKYLESLSKHQKSLTEILLELTEKEVEYQAEQ